MTEITSNILPVNAEHIITFVAFFFRNLGRL
jgi:hypothetical protein